ncbi:hypothetical protein AtubIFM57143_006613 [Aspergillus tubingensis]|nr:hypothetical protein AtubIFM57143_006613 [Aspergillus tubingensis]
MRDKADGGVPSAIEESGLANANHSGYKKTYLRSSDGSILYCVTTRQSSYSERNRQGAELQHRKLNCPPAASGWLNRDHLDVEIVIINRGIVRIFSRLSYLPATPARLPADALVLPADTIAGRRFEHPLQLILAEWLNRDHLDIEMIVFTRRIDRIKLPPASPLHFLPRHYPFQRPHAQDESSSLQVRAYCIIPGTTTTAIAASLVTRYHQTFVPLASAAGR